MYVCIFVYTLYCDKNNYFALYFLLLKRKKEKKNSIRIPRREFNNNFMNIFVQLFS